MNDKRIKIYINLFDVILDDLFLKKMAISYEDSCDVIPFLFFSFYPLPLSKYASKLLHLS